MDWLDHIREIANDTIKHGEMYFEHENMRYKLRRKECEFEGESFRLSWRMPDRTLLFEDFPTIDRSIDYVRNNREAC